MGSFKSMIKGGAAALALWPLVVGAATAQAGAPVGTATDQAAPADAANMSNGRRCVTLNTILDGEVLNGHEIRFELRDGTILLALLARDCPQLKFHGRFAYQAVAGRLCAGEGRIVARSGEVCLISAFSVAPAPVSLPDKPSSDAK